MAELTKRERQIRTAVNVAIISGGGGSLAYKGFTQGVNVGDNIPGGSANRSTIHAMPRKFPFQFQRFRVVQPVFKMVAGPTEALQATDLNFAHAFNIGGRSAFSGIAPRAFRANWGADGDIGKYVQATHDVEYGYRISDVIDLGQMTDTIDHWWGQAAPAGIVTPSNHLLFSEQNAENLIPHGLGYIGSTSVDTLNDGSVWNATALTAQVANATGAALLAPPMFLIEVPGSQRNVLLLGDSHIVGANAGGGAHLVGATEYGGPLGDADLNVSWVDKGLAALSAGVGWCKIAKGGDGDKFWQVANNWKFRRQLLQLANGTHIADLDATNTVTGATGSTTTAASTAYARGAAVRNVSAAKVYICTTAGTTSAGAAEFNAGDVLGTIVTSGTAVFLCLGAYTAPMLNAAVAIGQQMLVGDQIKTAFPGLPFIRAGLLPQPTTTDSFATIVNQTADTSAGAGLTSKRGIYLTLLITATLKALLQYDYLWRQDALVENDFAAFDGKIKVDDGTVVNKYMFAGHLTSPGHSLGGPAVTAVSLGL